MCLAIPGKVISIGTENAPSYRPRTVRRRNATRVPRLRPGSCRRGLRHGACGIRHQSCECGGSGTDLPRFGTDGMLAGELPPGEDTYIVKERV